ncbi:MAG TPA: hypothetical protein VGG99_25245 [Acetobacteraceae bacterium]|jgi:hypothetical protein
MNDFAPQNRHSDTEPPECAGGTQAPQSGWYDQLNVFGRAIGHRIAVQQGERLPDLPRGFAWRLVPETKGA